LHDLDASRIEVRGLRRRLGDEEGENEHFDVRQWPRQATCRSAGDSSAHFLVMNGCRCASKLPPRSISAASALSRKYGCVDDGTPDMRSRVAATVISMSESSHSSHSNVPDCLTCPMCGHSWPGSTESMERCVRSPIRESSFSLICCSEGVGVSKTT